MAIAQEKVRAWKFLETQLALIRDPILRNSIFAEYKQRALKEWGYFPKTGQIAKQEIQLDDWEKEFVEDIRKTQEFELDVRKEKREKTAKEAKARMLDYVRKGGRFVDLPEDLKNKHIWNLYYEACKEEIDSCIDFLEKKPLQMANKGV